MSKRRRKVHVLADILISLALSMALTIGFSSAIRSGAMVNAVSSSAVLEHEYKRGYDEGKEDGYKIGYQAALVVHSTPTPKPTATPRKTAVAQVRVTPAPAVAYIGNKRSDIFHKPTCSSVRQMNESNKVPLYSRAEAIDRGYRPCQRCNP